MSMKAELEIQTEELRSQFIRRLETRGYKVEQHARLTGKSGLEHSFDILAHRDNGFVAYDLAADILSSDESEIDLLETLSFDDKCYDCSIRDRILIACPKLDPVAADFAQRQRIRVFDENSLRAFLALPSQEERSGGIPVKVKSIPDLKEALSRLGYEVQDNARIKGKSGSEYSFAILASVDDGFIAHRLGIDDISAEEAGLTQVSSFDSKACDTCIEEKALLIAGKLADEAQQFARQQGIRIISLESDDGRLPARHDARGDSGVTAAKAKVFQRRAEPEVLELIPEAMARRFNAMPLAIRGKSLRVAMANPADIFALEALALQSRLRIEPVYATEKEIREAIDFNYKGLGQIEEQISRIPGADTADTQTLIEASEDAPVASALRIIIDEAAKARASDVHLEPEEDRLRVRYRIDGALQEVMSLPLKIHLPLTSRVKIIADMNIADHLRPQDGQFSIESKGRLLDVRVATSPTVRGEITVLRLLDKSLAVMELAELGFSTQSLARYEGMLKVPFGMILISGPTGAGKTTTLYASVNRLDKVSRNIITIEDPVEYRFANMNQIQVNPKAGVTFAGGLRSILRLDPDVILVGEIRDAETARIAVQSALTGHLVLSSIHANDAVGVIFRLLDLGIEPFLVSSAVIGVVAQRMVRRICPDCSADKEASMVEQLAYAKETGEKRARFLSGAGCELCSYTGYRGRTGIFEILPLSDRIRMQILDHASTAEIRQQAIEEGMVPLIKDGMLKVKQGITTPSEVLRNAYSTE